MLVLALDTATAAIVAGLVELDGTAATVRAEHVRVDGKGHTEHLAPAIAACHAEAGTGPRDVAAVVAGLGPGPFTGLRVGLVTATAVADALGVPAYGVCTLDALAHDAATAADAPAGPFLVATDARRREVYWARYTAAGARLAGPDVTRPAELDAAGAVGVAGDGARLHPAELTLPVLAPEYPTAAALVAVAAERLLAGAPGETLTPLYLRRPDAVPGRPKTVTAVTAR